jgi:hypothetical protein
VQQSLSDADDRAAYKLFKRRSTSELKIGRSPSKIAKPRGSLTVAALAKQKEAYAHAAASLDLANTRA